MSKFNVFAVTSFLFAALCASPGLSVQGEPQFTAEDQRQFLLQAKVIKRVSEGRVTLSDGQLTHDAHLSQAEFCRYNLAAYELAQLVGLGDMLPVTVERQLFGQSGSLEWWIPVQMNEGERFRNQIPPPDPTAWSAQIYKMRVFTNLIYDMNRNLGNVLYTKDWKLYMVDFARAFRLSHELENPKDLVKCSRELLDRLRGLQESDIAARTDKYLKRAEVEAVMARRDKIVAHFEGLIAEKGEGQVLY